MAVQPRLASAVMLVRDVAAGTGQGIEVFMVRRVIQSDFMPDVYVFPGGSVSADDRAAEQTEGVCTPVDAGDASLADPEGRTALGTGSRAAAIRELFEEAGILLAYHHGDILATSAENASRFAGYREAFNQRKASLVDMAGSEDLRLATDLLSYFAHWITPEGMPKRFDTHFFITTAPIAQEAAYDRLETSEGIWIAPAEALARSEQGTFPLVFATIYQLRELATFESVEAALAHTATQHVPVRIPILVQDEKGVRVHLAEDAAHEWDVPDHMRKG
jgi:8-oxo-dGTP pyrophosphatase MutT (NUDIX family)